MKFLVTIILFLIGTSAWAQKFILDKVLVNCPESLSCNERRTKMESLTGEYRSLVHLKDTIRLMSSDGGYSSFYYELIEENEKTSLNIHFKLKPLIEEINIGFSDRNLEADPNQLINIREGETYEELRLKSSIDGINKKLEALGYPYSSHRYEVIEKENKVHINIVITLGKPILFKKVSSNSKSAFVKEFLKNKFNKFYNRPFELNKYKIYLDEAQKELFDYGYYLINLDFTSKIKGQRVLLNIQVSNDTLFAFDFRNLQKEDHGKMMSLISDLFRKFKRPLSESTIKQAISDHYEKMALLNTKVKVETSKFVTKYAEVAVLYRLTFDEKYKTRLVDVHFDGNVYFTTEKLKKMFEKEAFELASINYYDQEYFDYFAGYLKNEYIARGFVQVRINGPMKTFDQGKRTSQVTYNIQEGQRAILRTISFQGLPEGAEEKILPFFNNKAGQPFNPINLAEDIKHVTAYLQEEGYYFAEVTNATEDSIVTYSRTGSDVDVMINVNAGPLVKLNRVIILGNYKTRRRVLTKKIRIEEGEVITPTKTRDIENAISSTGLFNSVVAYPVKHNAKSSSTDLVVKVTEREYGLLELAPGFRTDLGLKLTGTASYTNIGGANRSVTITGQVNQRLSYAVFDPRRRHEHKKITEYNSTFNFAQGNLFDSNVDYQLGLTFQRKRFYSFDGDIQRVNNTFTRDFSKRFSGSFRHQLEQITQTDATEARDKGSFKIGAITPSLTYDLRNSQVNPVKGAFFNMSCEFANPYFLSQKTSNLEINYYKLISRNRFYIPFKNGTVAISMAAGVQENLAKNVVNGPDGQPQIVQDVQQNGHTFNYKRTAGYIPNIKVFRLSGQDIVRGYTDEEINKLPNKYDISQVRIQDRAFMANFKLEPRYFITDNFMAGIFYDAGRVFVDQMNFNDLRSSVGISFKILTPVGTLDFDYGIKTLRKTNLDGSLETPGRLHVSIGFF
jgi:outer membrane protein insertion porin family